MHQIRKRLTYANVVASLALFLVIAGGSAFAASKLAKNSVGTKQIKSNAVTTAKIKKNTVTASKIKSGAVTGAKVASGAITGAKIASGAITGAQINPATTPFTRVVGKVSKEAVAAAISGNSYLIGTYTQPAGEIDTYVPSVTVHFPAECKPSREFASFFLIDPENPSSPNPYNEAGFEVFEDKVGGDLTKVIGYGQEPGSYVPVTFPAQPTTTQHTFYVFNAGGGCSTGSGVTIQSAKVEVLGTPSG